MAETDNSVSVSAEMSAHTDTEADNFRSLVQNIESYIVQNIESLKEGWVG